MSRRAGFATLLGVVLLLAVAPAAAAHSGVQSYVYIDIFETEMGGRVEFPVTDLNEVLGLDIPQDEDDARPVVEANLAAIHAYAAAHLAMGDGAEVWPLVFDGFSFLQNDGPGSYVIVNFEVDREFAETPRTFEVTYDGIIHQKADRNALLLIGTDWGTGTFNNDRSELLRYTDDNITQTVTLGRESFWRGVAGVIGLGVDHIGAGTDHILFVLALVLPSVLVFRGAGGWEPARGFAPSLWRVLKIVSMFTVAHTITLMLGGLGVITLPERPVETIIAISILLAAIHNIRPIFANKEWLLAFAFGLFHGFGFAGLLSDLGLTQDRQFISLLGFNLGIEIGQAVIIVLVFPGLFLLRRTRFYVGAMYAASGVLALIAAAWAVERGFGLELDVTRQVNRVLVWPELLGFLALFAVAAAAVLVVERRAGRLVAVAGDAPDRDR